MNDKEKKEFFDKFTKEDTYQTGVMRMYDGFLDPYDLWQWIEAKKTEWQSEAREEGLVDGYHVGCCEPYAEFNLEGIKDFLKSAKET